MEKSSKNYISLFGGKPDRGLPTPPPIPPRAEISRNQHVENVRVRHAEAISVRGIDARRMGGEGKREMMPFVNGSMHQLQTQNQDSQYYSPPFYFDKM
jgi:hypothetical protein